MPLKKITDRRAIVIGRNIAASGVFKCVDTLAYLLLVPLTIGYLNEYEYGLWLSINTISVWVNTFDIGLGSGLRNRLGEAMAKGDEEAARKYVSTAFFILIGIALILLGGGIVAVRSIDWYSLLNVRYEAVSKLTEIITISFVFFILNFALKFVGNVYQAMQKPAVMPLMNCAGHIIALISVFVLSKLTVGSLLFVAIAYSSALPLVYIIAYPITFKRIYPFLRPSLRYFDKGRVGNLLNLSLLFFVLQVAGLVLFSLSNFLISNMFGPEMVTPFNISQKYFSVLLVSLTIVLAPIWSAVTDAFAKNEMSWIKAAEKRLSRCLALLISVAIVMSSVSPAVYRIWVGSDITIPFELTALMAIYTIILLWSQTYGNLLNGMNKLHIQACNTIFAALLFYPLCRYLGFRYQLEGILMGMCIVNIPGAVLNTIQYYLVSQGKAKGLWNK